MECSSPGTTEDHKILVIDDSRFEQRLIREALLSCGHNCTPTFASSLEEAAHEFRSDNFELLLVDIHLGGQDGLEIMKQWRSDPSLGAIPVVAFSNMEKDTLRAYRAGVNCVISKSPDFHQFVSDMKSLLDFWIDVAQRPGVQRAPTYERTTGATGQS